MAEALHRGSCEFAVLGFYRWELGGVQRRDVPLLSHSLPYIFKHCLGFFNHTLIPRVFVVAVEVQVSTSTRFKVYNLGFIMLKAPGCCHHTHPSVLLIYH